MDHKKLLGGRLKKLRVKYGLSQEQVATVLNIDRSAYAYYEHGRSSPSNRNLVTLAKIYGVSTDWILGYDEAITFDEKAEIIAHLAEDEKTRLAYHLLLSIKDCNKSRRLKTRGL